MSILLTPRVGQAQAIWSKEHSLGQQWSAVVARPTAGSYRAHVIVYQGHDGRDLEQLQHRLSAQIGDEGYRATSYDFSAQTRYGGYRATSATYAPAQDDDKGYLSTSPT